MPPATTTMEDPARTDSGDAARGPGAAGSAGALLRAAREGQGMHIATLAAAIKVAPRKLEALENDLWDDLPGPTFTRALAQAVCRALKADPQRVMELLPPADTSMLDSTFGTINEPFAGPGGREPGIRGWIPRGPWWVAALLLLLAAAAVMWLPAGFMGRIVAGAPAAVSAGDATGAVTVPLSPASPPAQGSAAGTAAGTTPGSTTPSGATSPATGPGVSAAGVAPGTPQATEAAPGAAAPTALPTGELVVQCEARSWIEVIDARGRVLLSRNLEAGESLGLDGLAPLQVVIGNAAATRVLYKGKAVELESRVRDNVARLELR